MRPSRCSQLHAPACEPATPVGSTRFQHGWLSSSAAGRRIASRGITLPTLAWLLLFAIWSGTWLFLKVGLRDLPPLSFAWLRGLLAAIVLVVIVTELYLNRKPDGSYPSIMISSIDLKKLLGLVGAGELDRVAEYMVDELEKLHRAGVDFAVLSSNTPHIVFDEIRRRSPLPLISIVEETCKAAVSLSIKRPALLGTASTMAGSFYPQMFIKRGITIVQPDAEEQAYIHEKYMKEFVPGVFLPETRKRLLEIIGRMIEREGIDGVILGGTELPLILGNADAREVGIPFLDTKQIHAEAIVAALLW